MKVYCEYYKTCDYNEKNKKNKNTECFLLEGMEYSEVATCLDSNTAECYYSPNGYVKLKDEFIVAVERAIEKDNNN